VWRRAMPTCCGSWPICAASTWSAALLLVHQRCRSRLIAAAADWCIPLALMLWIEYSFCLLVCCYLAPDWLYICWFKLG
jgi:hypothetical protein